MMFFIITILPATLHAAMVHQSRNGGDSQGFFFKVGGRLYTRESTSESITDVFETSTGRVFDKDRKSHAQYAENNFSNEYEVLNRTLFDLADDKNVSEILVLPKMFFDESISNEEATTEEPFAVTGSLLDALGSAALTQDQIAPSRASRRPSTFLESPYYGVTTTEHSVKPTSAEKLISSSQQEIQTKRSQKMGLAQSQFLGHKFMQLYPSNMNRPSHISERQDKNEVKHSQTKGYLEVWGTKYYEDNRIDGDIQLQSDTVGDVPEKNPFAIETEMLQVKNDFERSNLPSIASGVKTFTDVKRDSYGESVKHYPEYLNMKSESKILENDGKQVEERVSQIEDQKVTVTLSNPLLFGHDYLMYPGAIIQPEMVTYKDTLKGLKQRKNNKARAYGSPVANPYDFIDHSIAKNKELQPFTTTVSSVPHLKGVCGLGTAPLFVRSSDVEETVGSGRTVVIQSNEDDCVSACLTNKVDDRLPFDCVSASYRKDTRDCQLTSGISRHLLRPHTGSIYYEKTCVDATVAEVCSGATVIRKEQTVLVGFIRETFATESIEECIALCITSKISAGYRCLSFVYYYEENLNCILSEASEVTAPRAMVKESMTDVDYFGVDHCYGIAYATDDKTVASTKIQNAHYVEDDIRVGEITAGSLVRPLRKMRSH
ncbi:unnamed protein product [Auanema sp. JU1783]|nr:unnamed protein product [Auanema sp. JU1783]